MPLRAFAGARSLCCQASLCVLIAASLCAAWPASAARFVVDTEDAALRRNIQAHLADSLPATAESARGRARLLDRVQQAVQALGYYSAELALERRGGTGGTLSERLRGQLSADDVVVRIRPGVRTTFAAVDISLVGEARDDPAFADLLAQTELRSGAPLHHGQYNAFKRRLLSLAQSRGYLDGEFQQARLQVDVGSASAVARLVYDSGRRYRFGEITFDESLISSATVAALAPFAAGEPYEQAALQQLRSRLQATGYFASVVIQPEVSETRGGHIPVRLDLLPAPRHSVELGVGYSTDIQERLSATWRSPRLNRWGHSQQTRLQYSPVNPSGGVIYRIPLGDRLTRNVQLRAGLENNEYGDLRSTLREGAVLYENGREDWVRSLSLRGIRESWRVVGNDESGDYLLLGASLAHRSREGSIVDPEAGLTQFYSVDVGSAALGSDSDIWRLYSQLRAVRRLNERYRVVGRLETGALLGNDLAAAQLPPSLAFFSGGDQSLRGFGYQAIGSDIEVRRGTQLRTGFTVGGTRLLVGSLEMQRYLNQNWRLALFADAGDAFEEDGFELNLGLGAGVHYLSPIGAIRFEIANGRNELGDDWRIHINIGAEL